MKMYISSLAMVRMEKKRKPWTAIAKILISCQCWFGYKIKLQDHSGSCEQKPIPVRPSTTGNYLVFLRTSELPPVTAHRAVHVLLSQGALGPLVQPKRCSQAGEGTVLMVVTVIA